MSFPRASFEMVNFDDTTKNASTCDLINSSKWIQFQLKRSRKTGRLSGNMLKASEEKDEGFPKNLKEPRVGIMRTWSLFTKISKIKCVCNMLRSGRLST